MGRIGSTFTVVVLTCSVLFLVAGISMNILWRRSFFYDGIRAIKAYQEEAVSPIMTTFHNILSKLYGSATFMLVIFAVYFSRHNKMPVLIFLLYFYTKNYIVYTMKMAFMDPRPFWSTTTVKQLEWGCPDQFGNPSGHSSSMFLFAMLVYDVVLRRDSPVLFILASLLGLTVPISRLYLGAHSTNQVLLGMLIELTCLVLYRYKLQAVLYNIANNLIRRKNIGQLFLILFGYALALFFPYLVYQLRAQNPTGQPFIGNMLIGCPHSKARTGLQMLTKTFEVSGFVGLVFGVLLALYLSKRENYRYLYGQWRYIVPGFLSTVARVLLESIPALIAYWIFSKYLPHRLTNAYLRFFSATFGMFLTGFLPVYFGR